MTAGDLIKILSKFPEDVKVLMDNGECGEFFELGSGDVSYRTVFKVEYDYGRPNTPIIHFEGEPRPDGEYTYGNGLGGYTIKILGSEFVISFG